MGVRRPLGGPERKNEYRICVSFASHNSPTHDPLHQHTYIAHIEIRRET